MVASDTDLRVRAIQRSTWLSKSGSERVGMAVEMNAVARSIAISGIKSRWPGIDEPALALKLIERMHGSEVAAKVKRSLTDGA